MKLKYRQEGTARNVVLYRTFCIRGQQLNLYGELKFLFGMEAERKRVLNGH